MNSYSLPRCTPEEVGIHSADILKLVRDLEQSGTEMHSLMILRHGKVCAEGWWSPYAQGTVQALQSFTKTVTGAAYGAAEQLGLLDLNERVLDIFPEYAHLTRGSYWDELRLYHLMTMSAGMDRMYPVKAEDWQPGFFTIPIANKPGSTMFYNSSACSLVGSCVRKRSGKSLLEFLREHVFSKIGIDSDRVKWLTHPDGQENGSGGIMMTTEDDARLIQLYLQHGMWNGEQVISRRWADMAVQLQNGHVARTGENCALGYGGMMWIRENCFYADGGMGQYGIGFPEKDMVIVITETIASAEANEAVTRLAFRFDRCVQEEPLPTNDADCAQLRAYLGALSLPKPACSGLHAALPIGKTFVIREGVVPLFAEDFCIFNAAYSEPVGTLRFTQEGRTLTMEVASASGVNTFRTSTDGRRWYNHLHSNSLATELALSADWVDETTLRMDLRWVESCRSRTATFRFLPDGNSIRITVEQGDVGGFDEGPWNALATAETVQEGDAV
ncbi:MAG: serine hydrolase [Clostridiaceae bacterium]|nr:serine hydrolase [Clostridiaceae bacterium]